ncbi:helix-turn-helix transcriptional regulator [Phaeobacter inhibens]|uniref:helix-turn-helix transcriptional regulator n=1 Tax=Phaeobacter inhibens TaxID=221822 RepID=UPI0018DB12C7|nr:helix-turn-helix transcriptional regulator [Phaeobacter inhibens]
MQGFRATTIPHQFLEEEIGFCQLGTSKIIEMVQSGISNVLWGVDLDARLVGLPEVDQRISGLRFQSLKQRSAVTFPMPDMDGTYRGAGVGIGFEDRGESFLARMARSGGTLALAAFSAHTRIQLLLSKRVSVSPLSKRQAEILHLLAVGLQLGAIADRLCIADSTVNLHLSQLKKKLNVRTKEQALAIALIEGWINP